MVEPRYSIGSWSQWRAGLCVPMIMVACTRPFWQWPSKPIRRCQGALVRTSFRKSHPRRKMPSSAEAFKGSLGVANGTPERARVGRSGPGIRRPLSPQQPHRRECVHRSSRSLERSCGRIAGKATWRRPALTTPQRLPVQYCEDRNRNQTKQCATWFRAHCHHTKALTLYARRF
jgi:hypothetical protein